MPYHALKLKLFGRELVWFGATQILGLLTARRYLFSLAGSPLSVPTVSFHFGLVDFIFSAVVLGLFIWAMTSHRRASRIIYRLFFLMVIIGGGQIIWSAFFSPIHALGLTVLTTAVMISVRLVMIQNIVVLLAMAGVGLIIGLSITPLVAVWALLILSFYDILAVYVTKHMVKMAKGMVGAGAIFGFIIPFTASGLKEKVGRIKPGDKFMILGSGDITLPLVLAASVAGTSLAQAWMVAGFSTIGLFITHLLFVNQKQRRPMAALPPIALMAIVGYLVALGLI